MAEDNPQSVVEDGTFTSRAHDIDRSLHQPDHQFIPLQYPLRTFRVLRLLSTQGDTSIRATLHERPFYQSSQSPDSRYLALSYEWGKPGHLDTIEVDGQPYYVRRNLYEFLRAACATGWLDDSEIFIDAICINQEDITERNAQVTRMSKVYSQAEQVCIWLGPSADGCDKLFEAYSLYPEHRKGILLLEYILGKYYSDEHGPHTFVLAAKSFLERSYWSRLWIVPEILLARRVIIYCGHSSMPLNERVANIHNDIRTLYDTQTLLLGPGHQLPRVYFSPSSLLALDYVGRQRESSSYGHDYLISNYGGRLCGDPRDAVYALWRIAAEPTKESRRRDHEKVTVDYGKSPLWLFFRVMANVWPARLLQFGVGLRKILRLTAPIYQNPLPLSVFNAAGMSRDEFDDRVFHVKLFSPSEMVPSWLQYWSLSSSTYPTLRCYWVRDSTPTPRMRLCTTADSRDGDYYFPIDGDCLHAGLIFRRTRDPGSHHISSNVSWHEYTLVGFGTEVRNDLYVEAVDVVPTDIELERAMQRLVSLERTPLRRRVGSGFKWHDLANCSIDINWLDMLHLTTPCGESTHNGDCGEYGCMSCNTDSSSM